MLNYSFAFCLPGFLSPGSPRSPSSPHSPRSPYSSPHSSQSPHSPYSPRSSQSPHSPQSPCSPRGGVRRQAKQNIGQIPSETPLSQQTTPAMYQPREGLQTTDTSRGLTFSLFYFMKFLDRLTYIALRNHLNIFAQQLKSELCT